MQQVGSTIIVYRTIAEMRGDDGYVAGNSCLQLEQAAKRQKDWRENLLWSTKHQIGNIT